MITDKDYGFYSFRISGFKRNRAAEEDVVTVSYGVKRQFDIEVKNIYEFICKICDREELEFLNIETIEKFVKVVHEEGLLEFLDFAFSNKNIIVVTKERDMRTYCHFLPVGRIVGVTSLGIDGKLVCQEENELFNKFWGEENSNELSY